MLSAGLIERRLPKMSIDYLLHESPVGYAIFQVVHQPDTVGNRLKEVQDSVQVGRFNYLLCIQELSNYPQRIFQSSVKW